MGHIPGPAAKRHIEPRERQNREHRSRHLVKNLFDRPDQAAESAEFRKRAGSRGHRVILAATPQKTAFQGPSRGTGSRQWLYSGQHLKRSLYRTLRRPKITLVVTGRAPCNSTIT